MCVYVSCNRKTTDEFCVAYVIPYSIVKKYAKIYFEKINSFMLKVLLIDNRTFSFVVRVMLPLRACIHNIHIYIVQQDTQCGLSE